GGALPAAAPAIPASAAPPGLALPSPALAASPADLPDHLSGPPAPASPGSIPSHAGPPRLAPSATTPTGVPDNAATGVPGVGGRVGGSALGVPEAYAASLPAVGSAPVSAPTSPYYFLGEASAYVPQVGALDDRVAAQPFSLPGAGDLRALLAGGEQSYSRSPGPAVPAAAPGADPRFYFLDPAGAATGSVPAVPQSARPPFDVNAIRRDFPILAERVNGRPLVWFDNAATTQKPQAVIDRLAYFYAHENSNIHRAAHELAARATDAYEGARAKVARFLGASSAEEIIFVRGATEGVNLVAQTFGKQHIGAGDEIVVSLLEHHANIVPWQQIAAEKGATIRVIPVDDRGQILLEEYRKLLNGRTKLVAITQVSNALGTVTPVQEIVAMGHRVGARVLVDGAQSVSHMRVNVQALDADFFVFSGHKIFGPTGIGAVYGKKDLLNSLPPWQGGGNMIADVTFERTLYHPAPTRFEAGTGNIADAVGLGAALDYLERIGIENVANYEHNLLVYATRGMQTVPGLRMIGTAREKASVLSFVLAGYSTEEVGRALNEEGIAVRSGHHCAQPILRRFGLEATVRPSLAFYNTCQEVDHMVAVLRGLARARR
ncbi:MAG: family 2A encapsulin nanocompartment cargo protein cysteine desulfurase, partial [Chloroflexales bacterium]